MRVEDQYPSADDALDGMCLPPIAGGTQDGVLDTMRAGRKRIEADWTDQAFIIGGAVCAVGSVLSADGMTEQDISCGPPIRDIIEVKASKAAREAIRLLNAATVELYPWSDENGWTGAFECVNQEFASVEDVDQEARYSLEGIELEGVGSDVGYHPAQAAILRIYDHAIGQRSTATA